LRVGSILAFGAFYALVHRIGVARAGTARPRARVNVPHRRVAIEQRPALDLTFAVKSIRIEAIVIAPVG
jgi:hypothetical protein